MKIAIIGSGISGLGAAYLLHKDHDITIFEKNDYVGGHSRTIEIPTGDTLTPVDTGFIVFNEDTYPNFTRLLRKLDVPSQKSNMSFSVRCQRTGLEYNGTSLNRLFAQRRNLVKLPLMLQNIGIISKGEVLQKRQRKKSRPVRK